MNVSCRRCVAVASLPQDFEDLSDVMQAGWPRHQCAVCFIIATLNRQPFCYLSLVVLASAHKCNHASKPLAVDMSVNCLPASTHIQPLPGHLHSLANDAGGNLHVRQENSGILTETESPCACEDEGHGWMQSAAVRSAISLLLGFRPASRRARCVACCYKGLGASWLHMSTLLQHTFLL